MLRATRTVSPGDELTISYGPQLGAAPAVQRRRQLLRQYGFLCHCEACEAPDLGAEAEAEGLRCCRAGCSGEACFGFVWQPISGASSPLPSLLLPLSRLTAGAVRTPASWQPLLAELLISTLPPSPAAAAVLAESQCTTCGTSLSPQQAAAALQDLRPAAVEEEEALQLLAATRQLPYPGQERAVRRLLMSRDKRRLHLHANNRLLGRSNARLAAAAAAVAGVPSAEEAAAAAAAAAGLVADWQLLAERAAAAARQPGPSESDLLGWAAEAAGGAAAAVERHYGPQSPAAANERLREGWLRLVLGCRRRQQQRAGAAAAAAADGGGGADSTESVELIQAACSVLRCHFG